MFLVYDIFAFFPEIYLLSCISVLLIYGTFYSTNTRIGFPILSVNVGWLSLQVIWFSLFILYFSPSFFAYIYNQLFITNYFIKIIKFTILLVLIFWLLSSFSYIKNQKINSFEFYILIMLSVISMLLVIQVYDLLSMYITIELQSLTFYILSSFKRTSEFSTESGLKYFILGAFSSMLILFGISILYGLTGLTNFDDFLIFFSSFYLFFDDLNLGIGLSLILISTAMLFKLVAAPFHMWAPDVYEGAPYPITFFFSILPKFVILILFSRFLILIFHDFLYIWQPTILFCAYFSITVGTFGALLQKKWKRFLAYSSINHMGFVLIGFAVEEISGIYSLLFYSFMYIIMTFSIFLFILILRYYKYPKYHQLRYIKDLNNLADSNPILSLSLSLILFSMIGVPPLSGFFAKVFIFFSCLQAGMYSLVIFSAAMSCIACFYYIHLIKIMYFHKNTNQLVFCSINKFTSFLLGTFMFLISFLFLDLEFFSLFLSHSTLLFNKLN